MKKLLVSILVFTGLILTFTVQSFASTANWTKVVDKQYFNHQSGTGEMFNIPISVPSGAIQTWVLPEGYIGLKLLASNGSLIADFSDYGVSFDSDISFEIHVYASTFNIIFPNSATGYDSLSKNTNYKLVALVPFEDKVPVLSGQTAFVTNYDNKITETEIRSYLSAYDDIDGNVTHKIVLDSTTYNHLTSPVGQFEIKYSVTDSAGNKALLTVIVLVKDITAPSMSLGSWTQNISYTKTLDVESLKNSITKSDNYDIASDVSVVIKSNAYTANKANVGSWPIVFEASDKAGNKLEKTYTVKVIDDVAPIASYNPVIIKPASSALIIANIMADITATDIIDGNVTSSLKVISDNFTGFGNIVGNYVITFEVSDSSLNKTQFSVTVKVTDSIPPVFFVVPGQFIRVQDIVSLTLEDFVDILIRTNQLNMTGTTTYTTLLNEYTGNENVPGTYAMSMCFRSTSGLEEVKSFAVQVIETEDFDGVVEEAKNLFTKVFDFVKDNPIKSGLILVGSVMAVGFVGYIVIGQNTYKPQHQRKSKYSKYRRK